MAQRRLRFEGSIAFFAPSIKGRLSRSSACISYPNRRGRDSCVQFFARRADMPLLLLPFFADVRNGAAAAPSGSSSIMAVTLTCSSTRSSDTLYGASSSIELISIMISTTARKYQKGLNFRQLGIVDSRSKISVTSETVPTQNVFQGLSSAVSAFLTGCRSSSQVGTNRIPKTSAKKYCIGCNSSGGFNSNLVLK